MAGLVVVLVVAIVYAQTLGAPFLWDDQFLIPGVKLVESGGSLDDYLKSPFWAGVNPESTLRTYYRPLVTASFALDHAVHGDNAAGYHLTNLILHLVNALLLFFLVKRAGARPAVASLLACCWALLPRLAEAAAWISGRTDLLAGTFALAALLAWGPKGWRRVLAALFLALGMFSKESAVAAAVAMAADEWWRQRGEPIRRRAGRTALSLLPIVVVLGIYAVLRVRALGLEFADRELGATGRLLTVLQAVGTYAAMLIDPLRPRAVIGTASIRSVSGVVAGVFVLIGALVVAVRHGRHLPRATLVGLALAVAAIVPVLHIVPLPIRTLAADRFLYLPTAGLTIAFANVVDRALGNRRPAWIAATVAAGVLFAASMRRVAVWSDEITFWVETYLDTPRDNSSAATNLASLYYRVGMYEDALALYRRALRYDDPHRRTASYNVGLALSRLGRNEEAERALLSGQPEWRPDTDRDFHLALIDLRLGRWEPARAKLQKSARVGHPGARWVLPQLAGIEEVQRRIAAGGPQVRPEHKARLASVLGVDAVAVPDWARALESPSVGNADALEAVLALVQAGGPEALRRAQKLYEARFGPLDPVITASIEVRLVDLDRLVAARKTLGLDEEKTRPAPVPRSSSGGG
jgi:protein O-mannosyl-transferase